MEIPELEAAMREYQIDESLITELRLAAAPLHPVSVGPVIDGMDEASSLRYVSHLIREAAAVLGKHIDHPDVLTLAGFPLIEPPARQQAQRRGDLTVKQAQEN